MKKFECKDCYHECVINFDLNKFRKPYFCIFGKEVCDWHEVKEDTTQVTTQVEDLESYIQLPDWCKVGEWVYDTTIKEYGCIKKDESKDWYFEHIEDGTIIQARKRPFNEAEMKALVGKVLRGDKFDFCALITYAEAETIETQHFTYTSDELINDYTIDGKPCYVLEHLENGEWVE